MAPLKDKPFAAILNSRQSKTPLGTDAWIPRTLEAVEYAVRELNATIVSSTGMITWDLVTWRAGQFAAPLELVVPSDDNGDGPAASVLCQQFDLSSERLSCHIVSNSSTARSRKSWWAERDRAVIKRADILIPVSLRANGALENLIVELGASKTIERRFAVRHAPAAHHERRKVDRALLNPALSDWDDDYLIHWTRACHGVWPGETAADFCRDLAASRDEYCRSARHTLVRMLTERRVRASSWHIGGRQPMVAFTELSPGDSLPHMRWRSRWARWSFEPFGIAIARDMADGLGIRPVRYVAPTDWDRLTPPERPYCHSTGQSGEFWPAEREWRLAGDLDLRDVPLDAMIVLVREPGDMAFIRNVWNGRVISIT